jgi:hypothetical protein
LKSPFGDLGIPDPSRSPFGDLGIWTRSFEESLWGPRDLDQYFFLF